MCSPAEVVSLPDPWECYGAALYHTNLASVDYGVEQAVVRCSSCGAMAKGKCEYCGQLV